MVAISTTGLEQVNIPGLMMPIIIICFKPKLTCRQFRFTWLVGGTRYSQPVDDSKISPKSKEILLLFVWFFLIPLLL